jgi:DNA polymerase III delta prime subunit
LTFDDEFITLDSLLQPLIPLLKYPLPNEQEVKAIVTRTLDELPDANLKNNSEQTIATLTRACQGLPQGEIELLLKRYLNFANSPAALSTRILQHKVSKFSGEGIEYIANPDVSEAAGLDNLSAHAANLIKLMDSNALKYNLRPPKGLLLLGVPGTGKTLSAKLIAQSLNVPLLGVSWGNILAADSPDRALSKLLEVAENLHAVILWDDFDKGFTDWESSEGGVSRRLSQKTLTWMQEHESKVYVIGTINRLELVKTEILRRFEDIFFIDLPHLGAMFEIFRLHLAKHFPAQFGEGCNPWDDRIWYRVLKAYKGATPAEIGNAVKRCKERFYCGLSAEKREGGGIMARVTVEALLYQRTQFIPISISRSEDIQGIRNQAVNIQKAASEDSSRFAGSTQQLFEYQPCGLK